MRIVWTEPALEDLEAIYAFISRDDPQAAHRVVTRIHNGVQAHLAEMPRMGRPGRVAGTREFMMRGLPFIVPYRIEGEIVQILRVLHGAQEWPDQFQE